jgi:hypothetical protein
MAWTAQVGTLTAPSTYRAKLYYPPHFFEIFLLDISAIKVGGGYSQSLISFYPIYYILNIPNLHIISIYYIYLIYLIIILYPLFISPSYYLNNNTTHTPSPLFLKTKQKHAINPYKKHKKNPSHIFSKTKK